MCLAIPMQVLAMEGRFARCIGRQGEAHLDTMLTGPLEPGQWVLAFLGAAREVVSAAHAAHINDALDALCALMAGEAPDLERHFADLVGREPQLPDFLQRGVPDA